MKNIATLQIVRIFIYYDFVMTFRMLVYVRHQNSISVQTKDILTGCSADIDAYVYGNVLVFLMYMDVLRFARKCYFGQ